MIPLVVKSAAQSLFKSSYPDYRSNKLYTTTTIIIIIISYHIPCRVSGLTTCSGPINSLEVIPGVDFRFVSNMVDITQLDCHNYRQITNGIN